MALIKISRSGRKAISKPEQPRECCYYISHIDSPRFLSAGINSIVYLVLNRQNCSFTKRSSTTSVQQNDDIKNLAAKACIFDQCIYPIGQLIRLNCYIFFLFTKFKRFSCQIYPLIEQITKDKVFKELDNCYSGQKVFLAVGRDVRLWPWPSP